jgi:hypothetical protein
MRVLEVVLALMACVMLFAAGCSSEEGDTPSDTPADETGQASSDRIRRDGEKALDEEYGEAEFEEPLGEPEETSQFENRIGADEYPQAEAPEGMQEFKWDFSEPHKFVYDFEQKVEMDAGSMGSQSMNATAVLTVKAKGDATADVILSNMTTDMLQRQGTEMPPTVMQGMTEDSRIPGADASQGELVKLLFPLPAEPIEIGGSSAIPGKWPFNAYGSLLWITGETTVTLAGYVEIDGRVCARLDVAVDISNLDVPEELEGRYEALTKGSGVVYFDVEDKCFHSGELAVIMSARTETEKPYKARMSMDSDNFIKFTRNMDKEKEANEE